MRPQMEEWGKISKQKSKWLPNKRTEQSQQACRWGFKPFICEMRLREYKSTLSDKGLNYLISVKFLILETIVSQRPWRYVSIKTFSNSKIQPWHNCTDNETDAGHHRNIVRVNRELSQDAMTKSKYNILFLKQPRVAGIVSWFLLHCIKN